MALEVLAFGLTLIAAVFHALWNFVARKFKGNFGLIYLSQLFGLFVLSWATIPFWNATELDAARANVVATGIIHVIYILLLAFAYKLGDISIVYPISRGSGVALTCVGSLWFGTSSEDTSELTPLVWIGIICIVTGVLWLGFLPKLASIPLFARVGTYITPRRYIFSQELNQEANGIPRQFDPTAESAVLDARANVSVAESESVLIPPRSDDSPVTLSPASDEVTMESIPPGTLNSTPPSRLVADSLTVPAAQIPLPLVQNENMVHGDAVPFPAQHADGEGLKSPIPATPLDKTMSNSTSAALLALAVGVSIAAYSIVDSTGVHIMHPIPYLFMMHVITTVLVTPYVYWFWIPQLKEAVLQHKRYAAFVGTATFGSYLLILAVYQMANVAIIVALRESSVVIGSVLGVIFLKEPFTIGKGLAITSIVIGLIIVKAG